MGEGWGHGRLKKVEIFELKLRIQGTIFFTDVPFIACVINWANVLLITWIGHIFFPEFDLSYFGIFSLVCLFL